MEKVGPIGPNKGPTGILGSADRGYRESFAVRFGQRLGLSYLVGWLLTAGLAESTQPGQRDPVAPAHPAIGGWRGRAGVLLDPAEGNESPVQPAELLGLSAFQLHQTVLPDLTI